MAEEMTLMSVKLDPGKLAPLVGRLEAAEKRIAALEKIIADARECADDCDGGCAEKRK